MLSMHRRYSWWPYFSRDLAASPDPRYLDTPRPLAFAHRGGAYHPEIEGLENTVAAFRHAVDLGYTYLETDVHVTSDGVLLAFHDTVLDRVTDRTGSIAESTYAEVQHALIAGKEPVPTLAELFDAFPDARFNIDLKSEGAVESLVGLHRGAPGLGPGADRVVLRVPAQRVPAAYARAGSPRRPIRWRWRPSSSPPVPGWPGCSRGAGPCALQIPHRRGPLTVASRRLVRRAHAAGLQVHVWTIDDPIEMNTLLDRGVDGIMTDRTDILRDVLRVRGQWNGPEGDS